MHKLLILGATSGIGRALALEFAPSAAAIYLGGREAAELERLARDLRVRFRCRVSWDTFEAVYFDDHAHYLDRAVSALGGLDAAILSFGELGDQEEAIRRFPHARYVIDTNFVGMASFLTHIANYLEEQETGWIIAVSSVAGDRGRRSNYIYGSAKAGLSVFLQGLRNRLHPAGVRVLTVKPGFVDTPMIYGRKGLFLVASPRDVARSIHRAWRKKKDVVYTPWFWRPLLWVARCIPETIFKRLKL